MLNAASQLDLCLRALLQYRHLLHFSLWQSFSAFRSHHLPRQLHERSHRSFHTQKPAKCKHFLPKEWEEPFTLPELGLDWAFLLNRKNRDVIAENIAQRKGVGDIDKVLALADELKAEQNAEQKKIIKENLISEAFDIPNFSHPNSPIGDDTEAQEVNVVGSKREFGFKPRMVREIAGKGLRMYRDENLTFTTGSKTYFLEDGLARLEEALVMYTVERLMAKGFELVSVPDLLQCDVVDSCGFKTSTDRSQVYRLHPKCFTDVCLSGTAEMALAGYFMNDVIPHEELPKKVMAVSRCYRAEAAEKAIERGLYRVHHFTKVEMFGVTASENGTESDNLLQDILSVEIELFENLGLHFRLSITFNGQLVMVSQQRSKDSSYKSH